MPTPTLILAHAGTPLVGAKPTLHATEVQRHRALYPVAHAIAASRFAPNLSLRGETHDFRDLAADIVDAWAYAIHPGHVWSDDHIETNINESLDGLSFSGSTDLSDFFTFPKEYFALNRSHPRLLSSIFAIVEEAADELFIRTLTPLSGARDFVDLYLGCAREEFYDFEASEAQNKDMSLFDHLRNSLLHATTAPWNMTKDLGAHMMRCAYNSRRISPFLTLDECIATVAALKSKRAKQICTSIIKCVTALQAIGERTHAERASFRTVSSSNDLETFPMPIAFISDPNQRTIEISCDMASQYLESSLAPTYLDLFEGHFASPAMIDAASTVLLAQREALEILKRTITHLQRWEQPCTN